MPLYIPEDKRPRGDFEMNSPMSASGSAPAPDKSGEVKGFAREEDGGRNINVGISDEDLMAEAASDPLFSQLMEMDKGAPEEFKRAKLEMYRGAKARDLFAEGIRQDARYGNILSTLASRMIDVGAKTFISAPKNVFKLISSAEDNIAASVTEVARIDDNKKPGDLLRKEPGVLKQIAEYLSDTAVAKTLNRFEHVTDEDKRERMADNFANERWGSIVAEESGDAFLSTVYTMAIMEGAGIRYGGGVKGGGSIPKRFGKRMLSLPALYNAGKMGIFSFLTTDGSISDRVKAGAWMSAFASTGAFSSLQPNKARRVLADVLMNSGLSLGKGSYKDAYEMALSNSKQPDGTHRNLGWHTAIELSKVATPDVVFGFMVNSAKADLQNIRKARSITRAAGKIKAETSKIDVEQDLEVPPKLEEMWKMVFNLDRVSNDIMMKDDPEIAARKSVEEIASVQEGVKPTAEVKDAVPKAEVGKIQKPDGETVQQKTGEGVLRDEGVRQKAEEKVEEKPQTDPPEPVKAITDKAADLEKVLSEAEGYQGGKIEAPAAKPEPEIPVPSSKDFPDGKIAGDSFGVLDNIGKNPGAFKTLFTNIKNRLDVLAGKEGRLPAENDVQKVVRKELLDYSKLFLDESGRKEMLRILAGKPTLGADEVLLAKNIIDRSTARTFRDKTIVDYNTATQMSRLDAQKSRSDMLAKDRKSIKAFIETIKTRPSEADVLRQDAKEQLAQKQIVADYARQMLADNDYGRTKEGRVLLGLVNKKRITPKDMVSALERIDKYAEWASKKFSVEEAYGAKKKAMQGYDEWKDEWRTGLGELVEKLDLRSKKKSEDGKLVDNADEIAGLGKALEYIGANKDMFDFIPDNIKDVQSLKGRAINSLTADEVGKVRDLVSFIDTGVSNQKSIFYQGQYRTLEDTRNRILEAAGYKDMLLGRRKSGWAVMEAGKLLGKQSLQLDTLMRLVDKELMNAVMGQLEQAARMPNNMMSELQTKMEKYGVDMTPSEWIKFSNRFSRSGFGKSFTTDRRKVVFENLPGGVEMTPGEIASLYLATKDAYSRGLLAQGYSLRQTAISAIVKGTGKSGMVKDVRDIPVMTEKDMETIPTLLTSKEKAFAEAVFEWHNTSIRDAYNRGSMKLWGFETARDTDHWTAEREGEYTMAEQKRDFQVGDQSAFMVGITSNPYITRKRTGGTAPLVIRDIVDRVREEGGIAHSFEAYGLPLTNARKILKDPEIINMIRQSAGDSGLKIIQRHFANIEGSLARPVANSAIDVLSAKSAAGIIALSPTAVLQQPLALMSAFPVLGFDGLKQYLKPIHLDARRKQFIENVKDRNNMLKERIDGHLMGRNIGAAMEESMFNKMLTGFEPWVAKQFKFMEAMDNHTMRGNINAAIDITARKYGLSAEDYLGGSEKFKSVENKFMVEASDLAWKSVVKGGQGVYSPIYRSVFQASGSPWMRFFGIFHSQKDQFVDAHVNAFLDFRDAVDEYKRLDIKSSHDKTKLLQAHAKYAGVFLFGLIAPMLAQLQIQEGNKAFRDKLRGKDEEEEAERRDQLQAYLDKLSDNPDVYDQSIRFARELSGNTYGGEVVRLMENLARYGGRQQLVSNPFLSSIENALRGGMDMVKSYDPDEEEFDEVKAARGASEMISNSVKPIGISIDFATKTATDIYEGYMKDKD